MTSLDSSGDHGELEHMGTEGRRNAKTQMRCSQRCALCEAGFVALRPDRSHQLLLSALHSGGGDRLTESVTDLCHILF